VLRWCNAVGSNGAVACCSTGLGEGVVGGTMVVGWRLDDPDYKSRTPSINRISVVRFRSWQENQWCCFKSYPFIADRVAHDRVPVRLWSDLIWIPDFRSDSQDLIVPFRHATFTNKPPNLIENNPSSICIEELLQISPVLSKTNPRLSGNYVRSPKLLGIFRIKSENDS
jgi:hypothetical protein